MTDNKRQAEDQEILAEIITNEKIVEHPTKGRIKFRTPTLELQRKIDAIARAKKKLLRDATDQIPDPEAPNGYRIVPAYKSKEVLSKEYEALGWWTEEHEQKVNNISARYTELIARLELLGFESEYQIYRDLDEKRARLLKLFADQNDEKVRNAIIRITQVGSDSDYEDIKLIKENGPSTEVDDILAEIEIQRTLYDSYVALAKIHIELTKLEAERNTLFSDSWQEQLQYYIRLAQVFYCSEYIETGKSLYTSIDEMEKETDLEFIQWIFTELQSFWQGISTETRHRLSKYDFTGRLNSEKSLLEESPVQPESNKDGDSAEKPLMLSSEVTVTPDPLPTPS